ncbi:hypothetical protein V8E36_004416 [Tilletia maclaganii]
MLSLCEYARYSRQLLLPPPAFDGVRSQVKLRDARVLVVGAGGLGCPAITYLVAAGVGSITIVDSDVVELSNLARQFLHSTAAAETRTFKADSIAEAAHRINPHVTVIPRCVDFTTHNALDLVRGNDLVLDCTDNPLTRYLSNDAAVLAGIPVVSGAAQGVEGQVVVLNKPLAHPERGPCYRCLFPKSPRPEETQNCSDGGVLGIITGLIGTLQALEAIKLITGIGEDPLAPPTLLLASPLSVSTPPFRTIKLRPRRAATCRSCGDAALPDHIVSLEQEDYLTFCGIKSNDGSSAASILSHISVTDFARQHSDEPSPAPDPVVSDHTVVARIKQPASTERLPPGPQSSTPSQPSSVPQAPPIALPTAATPRSVIIDVRPPHEYRIAHLTPSRNVPLAKIRRSLQRLKRERASPSTTHVSSQQQQPGGTTSAKGGAASAVWDELGLLDAVVREQREARVADVHVLCRRGNDSQEAILLLNEIVTLTQEADRRAGDTSAASDATTIGSATTPSRTDRVPIEPLLDDGGTAGAGVRFHNVKGGLHAYAAQVDPTFPVY